MATTVEYGLDGARRTYGPITTDHKNPSQDVTYGKEKEMVFRLNVLDVPVTATNDAVVQSIPANSVITKVVVRPATTTFAGGTDYDIGIYKASDGSTVDADGIFDAITLALLNSGKAFYPGTALAGAEVGFSVGADAVQVKIGASNGTFTAGETEIIIFYVG